MFLFLFPSQTLSLHHQSGPKDLITVTVEPLHNGRLGDRRKWPLWRGARYWEVGLQYDKFFFIFFYVVQHVLHVLRSCLPLSLSNVAKGQFRPNFQISFSKILTNK